MKECDAAKLRYPKLEIKIKQEGISKKILSYAVKMKYSTFLNKQRYGKNGDFTVQEAIKIARFLGKTVEELFDNE